MPRKTRHNEIVTPELLEQVDSKNMQLLDEFVDYLKSIQRSNATIEQYIYDIKIAFVWNLQFNGNKFFIDWTKRNVVAYQNWLLNTNGNSPARVRRLKAALSSLSNFVENVMDDEYPQFRNIINKIESPANVPVREKIVLGDEEILPLLEKLTESKQYDKACLIALAYYSGRRKSELVRFKVSDFGDDHLVCGGCLYKSSPIKTKGRGANGKMLNCFTLAKQFKPYLDNWLSYREMKGIESEWLFPNPIDQTEHMKASRIDSWLESIRNQFDFDLYAHALRHSLTSNLQRAGVPDSVIQQYFGWESIDMVSVYSDLEADEQLSMYFTEDGIKAKEQRGFDEI